MGTYLGIGQSLERAKQELKIVHKQEIIQPKIRHEKQPEKPLQIEHEKQVQKKINQLLTPF
jgi:hypothetical protein